MTNQPRSDYPQLPIAELHAMLMDPSVPDKDISPYLMVDVTASGAFTPQVRINPSKLQEDFAESAAALASLNAIARWRRQRRYRHRAKSKDVRIVSEGDSWFQFPFLLDDVIDQLWNSFAIFSVGAAGDLLTDMIRQNEVASAVVAEQPQIILLSAGGNDLLGGGRLVEHIEPFQPTRPVGDYVGERFLAFRDTKIRQFRSVIVGALNAGSASHVVTHSYGYAIPNAGRWLGDPLNGFGITDPEAQRALVRLLVDSFHEGLEALQADPALHGRITVVDARDAVPDNGWWDELHPNNSGFREVAKRFRQAIDAALSAEARITETPRKPQLLQASRVSYDPASAAGAAHEIFAAQFTEATLIAELGRRMALIERGADIDPALVPTSSVEGLFDHFAKLGRRILQRAERDAFGLLCGSDPDDKADRDALRGAFNLGSAAIIAHLAALLTGGVFSLPAAAAAVIAPILVNRFGGAAWETACEVWEERLTEQQEAAGRVVPVVEGLSSSPAARRATARRSAMRTSPAHLPLYGSRRLLDLLSTGESLPMSSGGLMMEATVEGSPTITGARIKSSLERAEAALRKSVEANPNTTAKAEDVKELIASARSGMQKLSERGERAIILPSEAIGIEAVVIADGTRPVLFVQDDTLVTEGVELAPWKGAIDHFAGKIASICRCVGRIATDKGICGTGFAAGNGLVITNRHVLETFAVEQQNDRGESEWHFLEDDVHIDFAGEKDMNRSRRFAIADVKYAGVNPINFQINFAHADIAVLACRLDNDFPEPPVTSASSLNSLVLRRNVFSVGFPAEPTAYYGASGDVPPARHEHVDVINSLFDGTFGVKRFAPGKIVKKPGMLHDDTQGWITAHDCSTLAGNSGSCVIDFYTRGDLALGLHIGGKNRSENWAHVLSEFVDDLRPLDIRFE